MDELRFKASTKFMKGLTSKWMARTIRKKYGYKVNVQLNELDISSFNCDTTVKVNVEIKINSEEFMKIIKEFDMD